MLGLLSLKVFLDDTPLDLYFIMKENDQSHFIIIGCQVSSYPAKAFRMNFSPAAVNKSRSAFTIF